MGYMDNGVISFAWCRPGLICMGGLILSRFHPAAVRGASAVEAGVW